MKSSYLFGFRKAGFILASALSTVHGATVLDLSTGEGDAIDGNDNGTGNGGIGATLSTAPDDLTSIVATVTTVDILGYLDATGITVQSELANPGTAQTNIRNGALAIRSAADPITPNDPNAGQTAGNFNPGEAWIFSFDVPTELTRLNFSSWGNGDGEFTLSSSAFSDISITTSDLIGVDDFAFATPLKVPANTAITLQMTSDDTAGNELSVRLDEIELNAVPEPSTFLLSALTLIGLLKRKR